jgi:hypothetical protein
MKTAALVGVVLSLAGCSSRDDEPEPCSMLHRDGAYLQSYDERPGGTCGAVTDQVVVIDRNSLNTLPPGCAFDANDRVSKDECQLTRNYTCPLDGAPGTVSVIAVTKESDGGAKLSGLFTATMRDGDGAFVCASTYDIMAVRQ